MKIPQNQLVHLLSLLGIGCLLILSCKKSAPDPAPDLGTNVIGTYILSAISYGSTSSSPTQSGTLVVTRDGTALDRVNFEVTLIQSSSASGSRTTETKSVLLKEAGSAVDLYLGSTKIGTWRTNGMVVTGYPFDSTTLGFTGSK